MSDTERKRTEKRPIGDTGFTDGKGPATKMIKMCLGLEPHGEQEVIELGHALYRQWEQFYRPTSGSVAKTPDEIRQITNRMRDFLTSLRVLQSHGALPHPEDPDPGTPYPALSLGLINQWWHGIGDWKA
jgi:hypothetical protein